jgi:hypothetical protein
VVFGLCRRRGSPSAPGDLRAQAVATLLFLYCDAASDTSPWTVLSTGVLTLASSQLLARFSGSLERVLLRAPAPCSQLSKSYIDENRRDRPLARDHRPMFDSDITKLGGTARQLLHPAGSNVRIAWSDLPSECI